MVDARQERVFATVLGERRGELAVGQRSARREHPAEDPHPDHRGGVAQIPQ